MAGIQFQVVCTAVIDVNSPLPCPLTSPRALVNSIAHYKPIQDYVSVNQEQKAVFPFWGGAVWGSVDRKEKPTLGLNMPFSPNKWLGFPNLNVAQSNQLATRWLMDLLEQRCYSGSHSGYSYIAASVHFVFLSHTKLIHP